MASFESVIFLIGFLVCGGLALYKVFNALNGFRLYDWNISVITFILGLLAYGTMMLSRIVSYEDMLIGAMFGLGRLFLLLNVILFFIEQIKGFIGANENNIRKSYNSKEQQN